MQQDADGHFQKNVTLLAGGIESSNSQSNVTLVPSLSVMFPEIRIFVRTKLQFK